MTCIHINRAREKLTILISKIRNSSDEEFYEKSGPWVSPDEVKIKTGFFKVNVSAPDHFLHMIKKENVEEKVREVEEVLNNCSCFANEKVRRESDSIRREEMIRSHQEEKRTFNSLLENIKKTYKETTDRQYALIESERRETSLVRAENSQLQHALGLSKAQAEQLEIRLSEKSNELNRNNQALERLRRAFQDLLVSNATNSTEARIVKEQLDWTKGRITISDSRIGNLEEKIDQKQQQIESLRHSLTTLQITYQTETQEKDSKIKKQENEIKLLREKTGEAQENLFDIKENCKEGGLEELASQLGISLEYIDKIRKHYERLIDARKNFNRTNIETHERCIAVVKQEMVGQGVHIKYIQKICRKCEKLAEIRFELKKTRQEQYQASQEVPLYNI